MDLMSWLELLFRWTHVVAGIAWIGLLYFFNFVNAQVAKTYDADSRKKVVPELMPRALYWFRWGAAYTWITGFLLVAMVYYMPPNLTREGFGRNPGMFLSLALIVAVFFVYDAIWKVLGAKEPVGVAVSFVLVAILALGLWRVFIPRAVYIHLGALLGTIMAMNVWMRIWPSQRKILAAIQGGSAPDPAVVALAGLRSKHNTYMSVPLVMSMVSNHYPTVFASDLGWLSLLVMVLVGWGVTKLLFLKSSGAAPRKF